MSPRSLDRIRGALLGLAVGDSLGAPADGTAPQLAAWTEPTATALCLAESLLEFGFDPIDQLRRYSAWRHEGLCTSDGARPHPSQDMVAALDAFERSGRPWQDSGLDDDVSPLGRLAPIAIYFAQRPELAIARAADSAQTTNGERKVLDSTRYLAALLLGGLHGEPKERLLSPEYSFVPQLWTHTPLEARVRAMATGLFKVAVEDVPRPPLAGALYALHATSNFREGCLLAASLSGGQPSARAAIFGQLAGALYGADAIPSEWVQGLTRRDELETLAARLHEHARLPRPARVRGSEDADLRVDYVPRQNVPLRGRIGLTFAPGKRHLGLYSGAWRRDLETDLARLVDAYDTRHLALLLEDHELTAYEIPTVVEAAARLGIEVHRLPIVDGGVPESVTELASFVNALLDRVDAGDNVVIACRGGLGRTGLVAAAALIMLGAETADAIATVRATRMRTIENAEQVRFLHEHAGALRSAGRESLSGHVLAARRPLERRHYYAPRTSHDPPEDGPMRAAWDGDWSRLPDAEKISIEQLSEIGHLANGYTLTETYPEETRGAEQWAGSPGNYPWRPRLESMPTVGLLAALFYTVRGWRGLYTGPEREDDHHRTARDVYAAARAALMSGNDRVTFADFWALASRRPREGNGTETFDQSAARLWRAEPNLVRAYAAFRAAVDGENGLYLTLPGASAGSAGYELRERPRAKQLLVVFSLRVKSALERTPNVGSVAADCRASIVWLQGAVDPWLVKKVRGAAHRRPARVLADLSPEAVLQFAILRAGGLGWLLDGGAAAIEVEWLLDEALLRGLREPLALPTLAGTQTTPMSWWERELWQLVRRMVPDTEALLGRDCAEMLDRGHKLLVDRLLHDDAFGLHEHLRERLGSRP